MRSGMIVVQVGISLVLLICAGLLLRSFLSLQEVRPGFDDENVLTFGLSIPAARYPEPEDRVGFYEELEERLRVLPSVAAVGSVSRLPLTGAGAMAPYAYDDATAAQWESVTTDVSFVSPEYLEAIGTRLHAGRFFDSRDTKDSALVVVVDETLARKAWPDADPVGELVQLPVFRGGEVLREWHQVIGVVGHARIHDLTREVREQIYLPMAQRPRRSMSMVVRTREEPLGLPEQFRAIVAEMDVGLPVNDLRPLSEYVIDARAEARFTLLLMFSFGGIALVLACVGLFGVVSYSVALRTHEWRIRMALGAKARNIFALALNQGLRLLGVGLLLGIGASLLVTRGLESLLFGVSATDLLSFLGASALLSAVALAACYFPARRAVRTDQTVVLQSD